jgi:hypothetical protein
MKTEEGRIINERKIDWTALLIFLIPVCFAAVGWWWLTSYKLEALETRTKAVETKFEDIAIIKNELTWIKDGITDIKRSLNGKLRNQSR